MNRRLSLALVLVGFLAAASPWAQYPASVGDAYLQGYAAAVLEREVGLARDAYTLRVEGGTVTVLLSPGAAGRKADAERALARVEGLAGVQVAMAPDPGPPVGTVERVVKSAEEVAGVMSTGVRFPQGDVFLPLLADPKQPQFFVSFRHFDAMGQTLDPHFSGFPMASVAYGENFGLYRKLGKREGDGIQVGMDGALFAQFDLDSVSMDLINADYTVGIPVTWRKGDTSLRFRFYHQSSHLGDEFILNYQPERVNLSFEAFQLLLSRQWGPWRAYAGGEYLVDRDPSDLGAGGLQWGAEYRGTEELFGLGRLVAGLDVKHFEETGWGGSYSAKVGLEFGQADPNRRHLRFMVEGYRGFAPYGQFYREKVWYLGGGFYLNF